MTMALPFRQKAMVKSEMSPKGELGNKVYNTPNVSINHNFLLQKKQPKNAKIKILANVKTSSSTKIPHTGDKASLDR